jgi:hypothetical protein
MFPREIPTTSGLCAFVAVLSPGNVAFRCFFLDCLWLRDAPTCPLRTQTVTASYFGIAPNEFPTARRLVRTSTRGPLLPNSPQGRPPPTPRARTLHTSRARHIAEQTLRAHTFSCYRGWFLMSTVQTTFGRTMFGAYELCFVADAVPFFLPSLLGQDLSFSG